MAAAPRLNARAGTVAPMPIRMIDTGHSRSVAGGGASRMEDYFNAMVLVGESFAAMTFPAIVLLPKEMT
jgi:hypothetical protein